jgi:hypothetical protein
MNLDVASGYIHYTKTIHNIRCKHTLILKLLVFFDQTLQFLI